MQQLPLLPIANTAPDASKNVVSKAPAGGDPQSRQEFGEEMERARAAVSREHDTSSAASNSSNRSPSNATNSEARTLSEQSSKQDGQSNAVASKADASNSQGGSMAPHETAENGPVRGQQESGESSIQDSNAVAASGVVATEPGNRYGQEGSFILPVASFAKSGNAEFTAPPTNGVLANEMLARGQSSLAPGVASAAAGLRGPVDSSMVLDPDAPGSKGLNAALNAVLRNGVERGSSGSGNAVSSGVSNANANASAAGLAGNSLESGLNAQESVEPGKTIPGAGLGSEIAQQNRTAQTQGFVQNSGVSNENDVAQQVSLSVSGFAGNHLGKGLDKTGQQATAAFNPTEVNLTSVQSSASQEAQEGSLDPETLVRQPVQSQRLSVNGTNESLATASTQYLADVDISSTAQMELMRSASGEQDAGIDIKVDSLIATRGAESASDKGLSAIQATRPYVSSLPLPVDSAEWAEQLSQKLAWLGARNIQSAELHLNPADLGPIDVRIHIGADQSSINFSSQNATVRELLEANIHRLRDMLSDQGQAQSQASNDQGNGQGNAGAQSERGTGEFVSSNSNAGEASSTKAADNARASTVSDTLIDAYI